MRCNLMNLWCDIWSKKTTQINDVNDIFGTFCELKKADGFDTQDIKGYYEAFFEEWKSMENNIRLYVDNYKSVYEVGCGSGVNLYLFNKLHGVEKLGGLDYSKSLIEVAKSVIFSDDIKAMEADQLDISFQYDIVISDSVFQYFQTPDYGMEVLEKMYLKAKKMVIVTEIHDMEKMEEHLDYRRACVENYDEKYKGLDKTFYSKSMFEDFAKRVGAECVFIEPQNTLYWNNQFVFDCYIIKK